MFLALITLGFMGLTMAVKWGTASGLEKKRAALSEASELSGQAKYRLKVAVQEVTMTNGEIDKLKRRIKQHERKYDKLTKEYKEYQASAEEQAVMLARKIELEKKMDEQKGTGSGRL
ncbi:MAG: hypothetical protein O7G87_15365 [bacterium]|nr:hypothetical protein [bacterium]